MEMGSMERISLKELLLVDGYNVINDWPELVKIKDDFELARDRLTDILANYGGVMEFYIIIAFDAHGNDRAEQVYNVTPQLAVVYTGEGETADSYIEKKAYNMVRQGYRVYVVTSDQAEQMSVLGSGAYRVSAREFLAEVKRVNRLIADGGLAAGRDFSGRREVAGRINRETAKRLDELRRQH